MRRLNREIGEKGEKNEKEKGESEMIKIIKIETPLGEMVAGATDEGVCLLEFSDRRMLPTEYKELIRLLKTTMEDGENKHLQTLRKQLEEYFNGKRKEFTIPLVTPGTGFQQNSLEGITKYSIWLHKILSGAGYRFE